MTAAVHELIRQTAALPDDATHHQIANSVIELIQKETSRAPVHYQGAFYRLDPKTQLWGAWPRDQVEVLIGARYAGQKLCRRASDYRQVSGHLAQLVEDPEYFTDAPVGIAAAGEFWRVSALGAITREPLTHEHRQRMQIDQPPLIDAEDQAPLFFGILKNAFGPNDTEQTELLQMTLGAALTRVLWRYRIVLLLYGKTSTGKSTIMEVFRALFPDDMVGATTPANWGAEYYVAGLAGKVLNVVGELDPHSPIPGGAFKQVVGADVVEGRHSFGRPFAFVSRAAHVFNCNRMPPTRDKSDAFFRRWRIVEFANPMAAGSEDTGLAERIIADEMGAVAGWLLEGAAKLIQRGGLPETAAHTRLVDYWRSANNSALQFLLDTEFCKLAPDHQQGAAAVFEAYRKWASTEGVKPLGRSGFYEALADGAGRLKVSIFTDGHSKIKTVKGVSLVQGGI